MLFGHYKKGHAITVKVGIFGYKLGHCGLLSEFSVSFGV